MAANLGHSTALKTGAARTLLRLVRKGYETPAPLRDAAVIVCLSARKQGNERLLRKASEAAKQAGVELLAVHIDMPHLFGGLRHARELIDDMVLASTIGARIMRLESHDPAEALLDLARKSSASRIFVARNQPSLLRRQVSKELLRRANGFRIDVVGFERTAQHAEA